MPYMWTEPDVFLSRKGVDIYYLYPDDIAGNPPREHHFGFDPACTDESSEGAFDVRDVEPLLPEAVRANCAGDASAVMTALIDAGYLTTDGFLIDGVLYDDAEGIRKAVDAYLDRARAAGRQEESRL